MACPESLLTLARRLMQALRDVDELLDRLGATARWGESITALEGIVEGAGSAVERALRQAAGKDWDKDDTKLDLGGAVGGLLLTAVEVCEALAVCLEDSKILARVHAVRDSLLSGNRKNGARGLATIEFGLSSLLSIARAGAVGPIGNRSRVGGGEARR